MSNVPAGDRSFLEDVRRVVDDVEQIESLNHAWVELGAQLVALREEIDKPCGNRSHAFARRWLVGLAAVACRAARDLGMETDAEAIGKDIPF